MTDSVHPKVRAWLGPVERDFLASPFTKKILLGTFATTLNHVMPKWWLFPGSSPEAIPQIPPLHP